MQNNSSIYLSKLSFTQPGYKSLASSSVNYLKEEGLMKKSSETLNQKDYFDYQSHSRSKAQISTQQNLAKRASVDCMKKSIHPVSKFSISMSNEEFCGNKYEDLKPFNYILTDKSNTINSFSKLPSSRTSLNLSNLSSLKFQSTSRKSINLSTHDTKEANIQPNNKGFFLDRIKSKEKSPARKSINDKQNASKTSHTRHSSSYTFLVQSQNKIFSKKNMQNRLSPTKNKCVPVQEKKVDQHVKGVERLCFNDSQVNISISSEEEIEEPTQMTARFNFTGQDKKIHHETKHSDQLLTSLDNKLPYQHHRTITLSQFIIGPCKGKGRYGKVYLAIQKKTGFVYALKQISVSVIQSMIEQFINELKTQLFLHHPYITKVYGYFIQDSNFYLIMEYMTDGNLYEKIKKRGPLPELQAAGKLHQVSQGLKYMHNYQVIHRDLKPQNIVITFDVCKICDFSWAVKCEERRQTNCGTLDYLSPEMIQGNGYSSSIDLWAMGVLLYEMLVGKPPFYNISVKQTAKRIKQCEFVLPQSLSKNSRSLIECFLRKDPDERKEMDEILMHPFFEKIEE